MSLRDLAGEDISTPCISNIINGKRGVTKHSGECLLKNINLLLDTNITLNWLLEEPTTQANKLLENNINSYIKEQVSIDVFEKIVTENTSYANTNLLLQAYELLSEGYRGISKNKALSYVDKGIEISFKICNFEKEISFKKLKGNIELSRGNIKYALTIYEELKERANTKIMQYSIHYNIVLCLGRLADYEKMLKEIEIIEKIYEISADDKRSLKMMKAISLAALKEYEKALQVYEELLRESINLNNIKDMCMLYYNIADIYFEIGDIELSKKYINLRLDQLSDIYIVKHLLFAATVFNDLTYIQKAKEKLVEGDLNSLHAIYNKELELCVKTNNVEMLKTSLDRCIELSIQIEHLANLNRFMYYKFEKEEYEKYLELFNKNDCF